MAPRATTTDKDRGFKRILATLKEASRSEVAIGWFPDAKHEVEAEGGGTKSIQTAELASIHEFGTSTIPARPMIGPVYDNNLLRYRARLKELWGKIVTLEISTEAALVIFGAMVEADLKRWITSGPHKPLSPETIARKGSSRPLIDTGAMRDQVMFRHQVGGPVKTG